MAEHQDNGAYKRRMDREEALNRKWDQPNHRRLLEMIMIPLVMK